MKKNRNEKIKKIKTQIIKSNDYLKEHPKGKIETQINKINTLIKKFKLQMFLEITENERVITMQENLETKLEVEKLDGCYVVKTDVEKSLASKEIIHERYKDLSKVEQAFRTMKTGLEEIRPLYLRKGNRTRAHVFVCSLAYILVKKFDELTKNVSLTLSEKIASFNRMQFVQMEINDEVIKKVLDNYNPSQNEILKAINVKLPRNL